MGRILAILIAGVVSVLIGAGSANADPIVVAHRGTNQGTAAQSIGSYHSAAKVAHVLEADIRFTRDKVAVISHDSSICNRAVKKTKWKTLRRCGVVPMSSMLRVANHYNRSVSLELKTKPTKKQIRKVVKELKKYGLKRHTVIFSFNRSTINKIRKMKLGVATGINASYPVSVETAKKYGGHISIRLSSLTPSNSAKYRVPGIDLRVHTTNSDAADQKALDVGADAIVTDRAASTIAYLRNN
jgi:glycerophosphoryl diester phosphodiesterase